MALIAPVNLRYNVRTLWFDPTDIPVKVGDKVVVETARGIELGVAASDLIEVTEEDISKLKSPLKPVLRIATEEDLAQAEEMDRLSHEAMPIFKDLARRTSEDMHPVSVEYLLDGDKAVFYFEAEDRIDFRDLVRQLASRFHVRIDMRQIGVRDEARIVGGLAHCGQEVCCKRLGGEFNPVSIRMAKDQDLSLNPQKISGLCGRLMCCLRYENDAYRDFKSRAPKIGATIKTPDGPAKVTEYDVPREVISLEVEGEKPVKVPLADFDKPKEGEKPTSVGKAAWQDAHESIEIVFGGSFQTNQFTGTDTLSSGGIVRNGRSSSHAGSILGLSARTKGEPLADESRTDKSHSQKREHSENGSTRTHRRRRSTVITGGSKQDDSVQNGGKGEKKDSSVNKVTVRPGQRSSGLSQAQQKAHEGKKRTSNRQANGKQQKSQKQEVENRQEPSKPKRRRRRSHKPKNSDSNIGNAQSKAN